MTHPQRVRLLYKMILRTHKALPPELRELGDRYVREEFKRHKNCDSSYVGPFMMEWTRYLVDLNKQIRSAMKVGDEAGLKHKAEYGTHLREEDLDMFSEYQLKQLLTLADELHGVSQSDASKN
ncbi:protein ACN9 mitochondrial [Echinococcus multilocularis]|uniref:Succinate dehydrogenase assembly factor 3 n=1 Tax=Echinococcus multilocularis TaxID=6211 RepID=A0A068YG17_ECHMU|nr:protein ACN9 mitochondrial [Echinococcus multilocularis]